MLKYCVILCLISAAVAQFPFIPDGSRVFEITPNNRIQHFILKRLNLVEFLTEPERVGIPVKVTVPLGFQKILSKILDTAGIEYTVGPSIVGTLAGSVKDTVKGTVSTATGVVSGGAGAVKDTVSTATGVVSGGAGVVKDTVSGVTGTVTGVGKKVFGGIFS